MRRILTCILLYLIIFADSTIAQDVDSIQFKKYGYKIEQSINKDWLLKKMNGNRVPLMLTPQRISDIKSAIKSDSISKKVYAIIKRTADNYTNLSIPLVCTSKHEDSRDAETRCVTLALAASIEKDNDRYIQRLNREMLSVCDSLDWSKPRGYLNVAEFSFAISLGLNWCYDRLPATTIEKVKNTLIKNVIKPTYDTNNLPAVWWINSSNNWNQVCHAGLIAASIVSADKNPELAARTISRALNNLPRALSTYYPDGAFPEGLMYWEYATNFTTYIVEMLSSAFGTDFNIMQSPGFQKSPIFALMTVGKTGNAYDFADGSLEIWERLYYPQMAWFDYKNGVNKYLNREEYSNYLDKMLMRDEGTISFQAISLLWQSTTINNTKLFSKPQFWIGKGLNPIGIIQSSKPQDFYFAAKGGKAHLSHGNMDAGSFIFEQDSVRWAIDLGIQGYAALEKIMGSELWDFNQKSRRWELLTKNNMGHNTITINDQLFDVDAFSDIVKKTNKSFSIDLTKQYLGNAKLVRRTICNNNHGVTIFDKITPNSLTKKITWAMHTTSDIQVIGNKIILSKNNKTCTLDVIQPQHATIKIVSLYPPPLAHDIIIPNLKRIEIIQNENNIKKFENFKVQIGR